MSVIVTNKFLVPSGSGEIHVFPVNRMQAAAVVHRADRLIGGIDDPKCAESAAEDINTGTDEIRVHDAWLNEDTGSSWFPKVHKDMFIGVSDGDTGVNSLLLCTVSAEGKVAWFCVVRDNNTDEEV